MKKLIILLSISFLASCSTRLSMDGSKVRVVRDKAEVQNMEFVATVEGTSTMTGVLKGKGYNNALNECINEAGKHGATHVLIPEGRGVYWTTNQIVRGEAYRSKK